MSRKDHSWIPGDLPPFAPAGPALGEWTVLVFFANGDAPATGTNNQAHAEFWSAVSQRLEAVGIALDPGEREDWRDLGDRLRSDEPWARGVPRHDSIGPRPVRVRLRPLGTPPISATGERRREPTVPSSLGLVIGGGPGDATGAAVVSAMHGLGVPCAHAESLDGAVEVLLAQMLARVPVAADRGNPGTPGATAANNPTTADPWRPALLAPLIGLLVLHSVNPWLRGEVRTRFQLPGFSYDFLNFETVPLVAPLVVGLPTLAAYLVIGKLWHWTKVAPPRWACRALLVPALTTVYFAARFFTEGRIVSTHSHVVHSEGLGMLVETIGMFEPVGDDHFRYRQPAGVNYSHTIQPFWEPWAILLVAVAVGVLAATTLYRRRKNTEP